jgi:hypothetical protein
MTTGETFYSHIENGVRDWVRRLRDVGINTECSCGHEGYIQCQSLDPINDIQKIKDCLHEHGLWHYTIQFSYSSFGKDYTGWSQSIEIRSKAFRANLN